MADPTFEGLPTELKIRIIFKVPDLETLKSIIFASPVYHNVYLSRREEILDHMITRRFGQLVDQAEVLTAVRSKGLYYGKQRDEAIALLDKWRRRDEIRGLSQHQFSQFFEPNSWKEILQVRDFCELLDFFLEDIAINPPRPPWIELDQWKEYLPLKLSLSEKRRFTRAVCRLQVVKNIFNQPVFGRLGVLCDPSSPRTIATIEGTLDSYYKATWHKRSWQRNPSEQLGEDKVSARQIAWRLFHGTIPPWEYDEMGSVFGYFISKVHAMAQTISADLLRLSTATPCRYFWDIEPKEERPEGGLIEIADDLVRFYRSYEALAGLGPEFLFHTLHADRIDQRNDICENAGNYAWGAFLGGSAESEWDNRFPIIDPADNLNTPQDFEEVWSKLPPHEQPSEGWKKAWMLPNHHGNNLEDSMNLDRDKEADWKWCYALWDGSRLKEWKAPVLNGERTLSPETDYYYGYGPHGMN